MNYKKEYHRLKTKQDFIVGSLTMLGLAMIIVIGIMR